jgi:hypothetical protein
VKFVDRDRTVNLNQFRELHNFFHLWLVQKIEHVDSNFKFLVVFDAPVDIGLPESRYQFDAQFQNYDYTYRFWTALSLSPTVIKIGHINIFYGQNITVADQFRYIYAPELLFF